MVRITKTLFVGKRKYPMTFEGQDIFEALNESEKMSMRSVDKCGLCGDESLRLEARKITAKEGANRGKTFNYIKVICNKCRASLTAGKSINGDVYYWRTVKDAAGKSTGQYDWQQLVTKGEQGEDTEVPF